MIKYILIFYTAISVAGANIEGWNVQMNGGTLKERGKALVYLKGDLKLIKKRVPTDALPYLQSVRVVLGVPSNKGWAKYDNKVGEIQFKSVIAFVNGRHWYPDVLLHEMSHVYHAKAWEFDLKALTGPFKRHKARYEKMGRDALKLKPVPKNTLFLNYASSNEYEFFAEMSTVLFGVHRAWEQMDAETEMAIYSMWSEKKKAARQPINAREARLLLRSGRKLLLDK